MNQTMNKGGVLITESLRNCVRQTSCLEPHRGLIIAVHKFMEPYPTVGSIDLICVAFMDLLIQYVYPRIQGRAKFTLIYEINTDGGTATISLSTAINLTFEDNTLIPYEVILLEIYKIVIYYAEKYCGTDVLAVSIRVYCQGQKDRDSVKCPSIDESDIILNSTLVKTRTIQDLKNTDSYSSKNGDNSRYPTYITKIKTTTSSKQSPRQFMVGDIETLLYKVDNDPYKTHIPYAAGYMMVRPGKKPDNKDIIKFYSDDYKHIIADFMSRSTKMLQDMITRIITDVKKERRMIVIYFHNLGKFDGIILLRHIILFHKNLTIKPLIRNSQIYEIAIYSADKSRLLFKLRDSLNLIPGPLLELGSCLCPELGCKGSIDHDNVTVENLGQNKDEYNKYLEQDILLLGGVMQKAQEIYWNLYMLDIVTQITISSMALTIFRMRYYDDKKHRIYIPNKNADQFIREGYYGGHADVYTPYGTNLLLYDVNSLYPFVMKEFEMPGGKPVWHNNLRKKISNMELKDMFGFIKAIVVCPSDIHKPFLPNRIDDGTLIFPTGPFLGVYFSVELEYAKSIGYKVLPLSGYLFDRMESPFKEFVNDISNRRIEAKEKGNKALAFVEKTTMNSLYGRFAISPESTMCAIVSQEEADKMAFGMNGFISSYKLDEDKFIVIYKTNVKGDITDEWKPPSNTGVHISAAITAYARIHMYPHISRNDCYYTDTDSIVVKNPLPEEEVSPTVLGKFKLEHMIHTGMFTAPKSYLLRTFKNDVIIKHKGAGKAMADHEWFTKQLADTDLKRTLLYDNHFHKDWKKLLIQHKQCQITMGLSSNKRILVYNKKKQWVGTKPIHLGDDELKSINPTGNKAVMQLLDENEDLKNELKLMLNPLKQKVNPDPTSDLKQYDNVNNHQPNAKKKKKKKKPQKK